MAAGVEVRAAEEDHIYGIVIGRYLDEAVRVLPHNADIDQAYDASPRSFFSSSLISRANGGRQGAHSRSPMKHHFGRFLAYVLQWG